MRKGWVLVGLLGLVTVKPVAAAPNFFGSTGLLVIPTADVIRQREWNVHVHGTDTITSYGVNFGVFQKFELGVTGADPDSGSAKALINLKYQLLTETPKLPAIAIGSVDISDEFDLDPSIYAVVSKSFGKLGANTGSGYQLRGHLGYGAGIYDDKPFGGLDLVINPRLSLMGEIANDDFNFGARIGLSQEVRVDLAVLDGDFGAGISFNAVL